MMFKTLFNRGKFVFLCLPVFLLVCYQGYGQRWVAEHAKAIITPSLVEQTTSRLGSYMVKSRENPELALDSAGSFIARQFESFGLQPLDGSYFQDIRFCTFDLGSDIFLSIVKDLETKNYVLKKDFVPFEFSGSKPAEGDIVFAGYGITAPEYNYDDYRDVDVQGKIVVVFRQEPGQTDSSQVRFLGKELTRYAQLQEKQKMAMEHGAVGMLVIPGPMNYQSFEPEGYPWPSLATGPAEAAPPVRYCGAEPDMIPVVAAGESIIRELFGSVDTLRRLQQHIEHDMQPHSFVVPGKTLAMNIVFASRPLGRRNVAGYLKGSAPGLNDEVLIVGVHYDPAGYIGVNKADTGYFYDVVSPVSGLLAVARAFTTMPDPPGRSVIFMAFAGEKKGLPGAETYVRQPFISLDKTVAMLSLGIFPRNPGDSLEITGVSQNPDIAKIIRKQNSNTGIILAERKREQTEADGDLFSFFKKGIPALSFCTRPQANEPGTAGHSAGISAEKSALIARLEFLSAWNIANDHNHYKVAKPKDPADGKQKP